MRRLRSRLDGHRLELATEKTEIILLTGKQKATFENIQEMEVKDKLSYILRNT